MKKILIYQDYFHNYALIHEAFCNHFGEDAVSYCDADDILSGCLNGKVDLFVLGGGGDLYYCEKLNGDGNEAIRHYVEQGGNYLGICAGAYYACASLEWAKGDPNHEITGPRELAFFPGKAVGPVYEFIEDGDFNKSWEGSARLNYDNGVQNIETLVRYGGGPVFIQDEDKSGGFSVLARYADLPDQPAAIVECSVGRGKAILCSPHLESTPSGLKKALYRHRNSSFSWDQKTIKELTPCEEKIRDVWAALLNRSVENKKGVTRAV